MRKKIIILIQLVIIIVFLQTSFAKHLFGDSVQYIKQWYSDFTHIPERNKLNRLRDTFMRNNMSLQVHQVDYIIEVSDTAEKLNTFYGLYCVRQDKNPFLYGANLAKFCADIRASELLYPESL